MPPEGFHEVRRHIRRNPRPRGQKLGGWTIAGIVAFVWLWGQIFGFGSSSDSGALRRCPHRRAGDGWHPDTATRATRPPRTGSSRLSAQQVGQAGDQAADVIGQHAQRGRIVLQAKHTTVGGKVDSKVMYQVKGTAGPVHKADVAVVGTNGGFTRDAKAWGERHQVHWVDRERLRQWPEEGVPLHTLLRLSARRPRRTSVRRAA